MSTKWLSNVMSIQQSVTKRGDADSCDVMSLNYMLQIYPSLGFNYHWNLRNPMWSLKEKDDIWPPMIFFELLTPILKLKIIIFFITNCRLDGTIPSRSHSQTLYVELEMPTIGPNTFTNNIVFSVTYYLDLRNPITIYYISHFLPRKV